jgi:hypothetical protein
MPIKHYKLVDQTIVRTNGKIKGGVFSKIKKI